ncbi:Calcineurin-like phosphoesterase domain, apaH type [Parasponia andersonii]|uniref:Calcineurin-like phosphoesterase domain, apaH type n=1 Tax=Parasponia andersonii TaxID=3476 RepID=A0A2P5B0A5_PARAD|nr:Calcineurin-like phosphoesterase domain, apaH type [Parasponia andersonii]
MGALALTLTLIILVLRVTTISCSSPYSSRETIDKVEGEEFQFQSQNPVLIDVKGGPDSVLWVVQLSDLHFSAHHPDRALDFKKFVGPALSMINPSLVLITGDLTDGKSKDSLTMKLNEEEWLEYRDVMEDVVKSSRLDKSIFFDLRGNHDNFGFPVAGGSFDFFSKYSINGQLGRNKNVNSVTLQAAGQKHLFVGVDSTLSVGLRGPTNVFGHPTDELLAELDLELSQWDSQSTKPMTKISFGHFPLSFSALSNSGKSLKDIFLKHSVSAYICGHLHARFGKNLKRHHQLSHHILSLQKIFQFNPHQVSYDSIVNCSIGATPVKEFWEWEMGDWRKRRAMRILAIDRGHVSYVDIDLKSGGKKTIILPTFPIDSRFMSTSTSHHKYKCQVMVPSSYETVRALIFSVSPIVSVVARIYDSRPGNLNLVLEAKMGKIADNTSRGDLYVATWNYRAFEDPSPDRYWLEIEATDVTGRSTLTDLRPFSINGLNAKISWTWLEFKVMGCQWAALYFPLLWSALCFMLSILIVPKALLIFSNKRFTYKKFLSNKGFKTFIGWVLQELSKVPVVWFGMLGYLFYLVLFPWVIGKVFIDGEDRGYMTYKGWAVRSFDQRQKHEYVGFPDVMLIVIPHLLVVVLPSLLVTGFLAAEKDVYREQFLSLTGKKDDNDGKDKLKSCVGMRWIRKVLLVVCLAICWKHFKSCWALVKAYEMNPVLHFPAYTFTIPLLLAYTVYKTRSL